MAMELLAAAGQCMLTDAGQPDASRLSGATHPMQQGPGPRTRGSVSRSQSNGAALLDEASPMFILMSRILVVLITLLLVIIPWSEHYSMLDSFPHGQDTEFNLLAAFLILGLILLFVRSSKKRIRRYLTFRPLLLSMIPPAKYLLSGFRHGLVLTDADHPPHPGSCLDMCNLPLQI